MEPFKRLLRGLTDFRFQQLITPQVVGAVLMIAVAAAALGYVYNVIQGFNSSTGLGVLYLLILGPLGALFSIIWYRLVLELAVVAFRILAMRRERAALLREIATHG